MGQVLGPAWTTCARCGLPLRARRAVCTGCGAVTPFERLLVRIKGVVQSRSRAILHLRTRPDLVIWLLACMPLLVAPPLAAIVLSWRSGREVDRPFVVIIALVNIVISILVMMHVRAEILAFLSSLLHSFLPGMGGPPGRGVVLTPA